MEKDQYTITGKKILFVRATNTYRIEKVNTLVSGQCTILLHKCRIDLSPSIATAFNFIYIDFCTIKVFLY